MNAQTHDLDDEIRLMLRRSRRENLRQFLRAAILFACSGAAGVFGLVVWQSESAGVGCAIVATLLVTKLQNRRAR